MTPYSKENGGPLMYVSEEERKCKVSMMARAVRSVSEQLAAYIFFDRKKDRNRIKHIPTPLPTHT